MPQPEIERLRRGSSKKDVQKAISACISKMHDEHPGWANDRLVAACHSMAKRRLSRGN